MIHVFGGTDIGSVRKANQDRFAYEIISPQLAFVVLCDGMGGQNGGSVASETVTEFIAKILKRDLKEDATDKTIKSILMSAIAGANSVVYDTAKNDESLAGMGTTVIAAVFLRETMFAAYVGDSRIYKVSSTEEKQLTKDHTVVQMLVDLGKISQEDALSHPKRHYITRAVGVSDFVEPDFVVEDLTHQDIILLCSDGLYNYISPDTLFNHLSSCIESKSVKPLIDLANSGGGADNITAVITYREREQ